MKKTLSSLFLFLFGSMTTFSQSDSILYITIISDTALVSVHQSGGNVVPVFADTNINNITDGYTFSTFEVAFPNSRFPDMHNIYRVVCNNTGIAEALKTTFPDIFPDYYMDVPVLDAIYTPNDWGRVASGYTVNTWALDYINAKYAWGITHGDPSVIIGITDTYFDLSNPDLASQIVYVDENILPSSYEDHGTGVAGTAAGAADNGTGYPGIGFNCKLRVSSRRNVPSVMKDMTLTGPYKVRILNGSWQNGDAPTNLLFNRLGDRIIFNEIYENGTTTCFSAGNGYFYPSPINPSNYTFPASYDHVISTTFINAITCTSAGGSGDNCNEHNRYPGGDPDTFFTMQHNPRVDICAPGANIGGLTYNPALPTTDSMRYYGGNLSGTSFSSPLTAGVIGLMASVNPCLSPYQLEYALKYDPNIDIYSVPANHYVATPPRIGVGRLDAEKAVLNALGDEKCNDPATQTFEIVGVEVNTLCAPGFASNGVNPVLRPILKNGTPPYTYVWTRMGVNTTQLNDYTIAYPTITASAGTRLAAYYLTVYDNSPVQKVANKIIKIKLRTANTYELASRDSYMDMMDEPNKQDTIDPRDFDYWASPDVWNRLIADGGTTPQNPEYYSGGAPNYMYVRVRNVGCASYSHEDNAVVRAYWTLTSTGEHWTSDWTMANVPAAAGGTTPAGREITVSGSIAIPDLESSGEFIGYKLWYPPDPTLQVGNPTETALCFLSRIYEPTKTAPEFGAAFPLVSNTSINVKNNNNFVTRNMIVANLGRKLGPRRTIRVYVNNVNNTISTFGVQMLTERDIQLHFAGNPSQYMYVAMHMETGLYNLWANAGYKGNFAAYDDQSKTVFYDPATPLLLEGIALDTSEKYYIDLEFALRDGVPVNAPFASQKFHFRQLDSAGAVYGNVSFELGITEDDTTTRKGVLIVTEFSDGPTSGCQYAELTVANCGVNMAENVDVRGWIVNDNSGTLLGECDDYAVNPGHFRFAYDDYWAHVPVGSVIVMYNAGNNCYNLPDTLTHDTTKNIYWIPIGADGPLYVEQYNGVENSEVCSYCSDTGATIYTPAIDWKGINGLDSVADGVLVVCPGCTVEIPASPITYYAVGHLPSSAIYAAGSDSSLGALFLSNLNIYGGYTYVFTGNTGEELSDTTKWRVARADTAGVVPPTLGKVSDPFLAAITAHELNLPCCGSDTTSEGGEEAGKPGWHPQKDLGTAYSATSLKVYPNPANSIVHFEFPYATDIQIRIMDITGKMVDEQGLHNTGRAAFDVKNLAPGLYIYQVVANGQKQMGKVVINR